MDGCLLRSPVGEPGRRLVYGDFESWMKGAVGMDRLSLKRHSSEGLWGGPLYWGPWTKERLWIWASLPIGGPLGNLKGIRLPRHLVEKDSISGFLLDPEDIKMLSLGAIWNCGKGTELS